MTIKSLFKELSALEENKAIDLKWLLLELLELSKKDYFLNPNLEISSKQLKIFKEYQKLYLEESIPVQQLIGHTYFYGYKFFVTSDTLIPRKETELLIEKTLEVLNKKYSDLSKIKILDLGTGTGIIGIILKKLTNAHVTLVDINEKTLKVAAKNANYHNVDVEILLSDWFNNVDDKYDLIISNPPYIKTSYALENHVLKDPHRALYAGVSGLDAYQEILKNALRYLNDNYVIAFEHGYDQAEILDNLIKKHLNKVVIEKIKDYDNNDRIIIINK